MADSTDALRYYYETKHEAQRVFVRLYIKLRQKSRNPDRVYLWTRVGHNPLSAGDLCLIYYFLHGITLDSLLIVIFQCM